MAGSSKRSHGRRFGRKRNAPAPELHPPGYSSAKPKLQGYRIEPRSAVERRFLHEVTAAQVKGEAPGIPDVMRSDWDRVKLEEARWFQQQTKKEPVRFKLLEAHRKLGADFVRAAAAEATLEQEPQGKRIVTAREKRAEAAKARMGIPEPDRPAPSSREASSPDRVFENETPFLRKVRERAEEIAREREAGAEMEYDRSLERDRSR